MTRLYRQRTPEEEKFRQLCRSLVRHQGGRLSKLQNHVEISACLHWREGLTTAFHGWEDLYNRLNRAMDDPEMVIDGVLIYEDAQQDEVA